MFFGRAKRIKGVGNCYLIGIDTSKYSNNINKRVKKLYVVELLKDHPIILTQDYSMTDTSAVLK